MKNIPYIAIVVAVISLIIGIISRLTKCPVNMIGGLEAQAFLSFTNTCLLLALTFISLQILKK